MHHSAASTESVLHANPGTAKFCNECGNGDGATMALGTPPLMCHTRHISGGVQNPCMKKKKKRKSQLAQVAGGDIHNASTTRSTARRRKPCMSHTCLEPRAALQKRSRRENVALEITAMALKKWPFFCKN